MRVPDFEYLEPRSVADACTLLAEDPDGSALFAGGTDMMVDLKLGAARPRSDKCALMGACFSDDLDGIGDQFILNQDILQRSGEQGKILWSDYGFDQVLLHSKFKR